ncbi:MAG: dicarboxylate/amino acid:cation symporter [Bacteroidales bacterium]|nr:dicarboxylate/amino acid:cation symporter [Bacteroidales bacterium]
MNSVLKNYASTLAMLAGVVAGGLAGALLPALSPYLKPFGDIFLNLLFVLVIPMVFCSITLSFCRLRSGGRLGALLLRTGMVFGLIWLLYGSAAYLTVLLSGPLSSAGLSVADAVLPAQRRADALVSAFSVPDFPQLFSKYSILPLMIFSALFGAGISAAGQKGAPMAKALEAGNESVMRAMDFLMKAAPVGLGCYFADSVASIGPDVLGGYLKVFVLYCLLALLLFAVVNPALVMFARGKSVLGPFWRHIIPPSLTALATASSSVAMPGNIEAARRIGADESVAGAVVPLSTNLLKAGSVAGAVLKVAFLMAFCGLGVPTPACIGIAVLAAVVSGAVANGGVTGDLLICSLVGVEPSMVGVVMIIGTIIDIPATLLNSQTNVVAALLADKYASK